MRPLRATLPGVAAPALLGLLALFGSACFNGVIRVTGEVVDAESGAPLADVRVRVRKARMTLFARDFARVAEHEETVSGRFSASCWLCRGLSLRFSKDGYHSDRLEVALDPDDRGELWHSEGGVRVLLHSGTGAVTLTEITGTLSVSADQEWVLPLGLGFQGHAFLPEHVAEMAARSDAPDAAGSLRLRVERDASGAPRSVEVARPGGGQAFRGPAGARLVVADSEGGFLPYAPREHHFERIRLEMREAPGEGYAPELPLDLASDRTTWFYFRAGGRYGRGRVDPVLLARTSTGPRAEVSVSLELNPEPGSRNLHPLR